MKENTPSPDWEHAESEERRLLDESRNYRNLMRHLRELGGPERSKAEELIREINTREKQLKILLESAKRRYKDGGKKLATPEKGSLPE